MRLRWLDLLRSSAILGMVVYHAAYDLQEYYGWPFDVGHGRWKLFQIAVASLFLVVSGISAGFWTRTNAVDKGWRRGWFILSAAMLVSLATAIADERTWVSFGILHLLALAAFVLPFLRRVPPVLLGVCGLLVIALAPFDLMPHVVSVDYVPPIPWLGPVLLGFAVGIPVSRRTAKPSGQSRLFDALAWPGKHSLAIYLLHQPVILAVLWTIS
jgi:uncharacterized membrane protein